MPEGPEIRRAADEIEAALRLAPVSALHFTFSRLKRFEKLLQGRRVVQVETRGKAMLTRFDNELSIYSHNQLYGRWFVTTPQDYPQTNRKLRLAIHTERASALLYSASDIDVLTPAQIEAHPFLSNLGPDVLASDSGQIRSQLTAERYRRRRFASLLLDQRVLAGIGNYLRSEILFVAGIDPGLRPVDCSQAEIQRLADTAVILSNRAYRFRGVTTDPDLASELQDRGQSHDQYRHWVFGRGGEPCRQCGSSIIHDLVSGRRVYSCPVCQRARS